MYFICIETFLEIIYHMGEIYPKDYLYYILLTIKPNSVLENGLSNNCAYQIKLHYSN